MSAIRWTLRRSGAVRTTIAIRYHVSRESVRWLQDHAGVSERQSLDFIRAHAHQLADFHVLGIDNEGDACVVHADDCSTFLEDGFEFYDGDESVL